MSCNVFESVGSEVIMTLTAVETKTAEALTRRGVFLVDAFCNKANGQRLAKQRIMEVKEATDSVEKRYTVHKKLLDGLLYAVHRQIGQYKFGEADLPPNTDVGSDMLSYIRQKARFLHRNFDETQDIFTSPFFLTMYRNVYLNQRTQDPRLFFDDTCASSICFLMVAIIHHLFYRTSPALAPPPAKDLEMNPNFANGSIAEEMYHRLLDENISPAVPVLNNGKPINWDEAVEGFKILLAERVGYQGGQEEISNEDLFGAALG
ncbi:hypothetical protein [Absidia glauca]|uniref:Uncharacterized protein n=1 Tax=Absidia glauca TaxID=4829 RepID=A0A168PTT8_ABSGL|nr:hypothetical protein [Absidia glauca]